MLGQTKPPPLTWTHTLTRLRGPPKPEEERHNRESEVRGQRDGSLSFLSVAWDDKKNNNRLDKRTNYKDDWTPDRWRDRQTGRRDERIISHRGKSDSYLGVDTNLHKTSDGIWIFLFLGLFELKNKQKKKTGTRLFNLTSRMSSRQRWQRAWGGVRFLFACRGRGRRRDVSVHEWFEKWLTVRCCCSRGVCWFRVSCRRRLSYGLTVIDRSSAEYNNALFTVQEGDLALIIEELDEVRWQLFGFRRWSELKLKVEI